MAKKNEEIKNEVTVVETVKELDVASADKIVKNIAKKIGTIEKGYLSICGEVAKLKDGKAWKATGHKNLYDLCASEFGMARGTVSNLISIYERFGDGNYKLTEEASGKKLTELLAVIKAEKHPELVDKASEEAEAEESGEESGANVSRETLKKAKPIKTLEFEAATECCMSDYIDDVLAFLRNELEKAFDVNDFDALNHKVKLEIF